MSVKAKICGVTTPEAITSAINGGAYFIGFVFYPKSPRYVTPQKAAEIEKLIPAGIRKVAVVVDPSDEELKSIFAEFKPDFLQLHGNETQERVSDIRAKFSIPVIKALRIRSSDDVAVWGKYAKVADMLLFDARAPETALPGGNGLVFDWNLLRGRRFNVPWLLSGGLNATNICEAIALTGARMVDVSSSVESEPGKKDPSLIKEFLSKVKSLQCSND